MDLMEVVVDILYKSSAFSLVMVMVGLVRLAIFLKKKFTSVNKNKSKFVFINLSFYRE